jgi:hypothetical protein
MPSWDAISNFMVERQDNREMGQFDHVRMGAEGYVYPEQQPLELSEDQPDQFGLPGITTAGGGLDEQTDTRPSLTAVEPTAQPEQESADPFEVLSRVGTTVYDLPNMAIRSILRAGGEAVYSAGGIDEDQVKTWRKMLDLSGKMAEDEGVFPTARGLVEGVAQFGAGMFPPFKAMRAMGVSRPAAALISEGLSGAFGFNPDDPNVGNFINSFEGRPEWLKAIGDFIETDPNDTEAENRFRNMLQDVVPSAFIEGLVKVVSKVRNMDADTLIEAGEEAEQRLDGMMSGTTLSANPVSAAGDAMIAGAGKIASKLSDSGPINDNEFPSLRDVLVKKSEEMQVKPAERTQPTDDQMFDVVPESYEQGIIPEMQIETPVPRAPAGAKLPKKGRTQGIVDNIEEIADRIAERARPGIGTNVQYFYHLGPLVNKAQELGIPEEETRQAIKEFSMLYGATSPRTRTEPNLRSATLVRAKDKQNINYDEIVGPGGSGINEAGFPMMINEAKKGQAAGIHKLLIDQLRATGKIDYKTNPKPATFAENVGGNLNGVTVDTHAIRGALYMLNDIAPGSIPRQWFNSETAYKAYLADPSAVENYAGKGIADTLDGQVVDGSKQQTEYAIFSDLYRMVADRLGVQPAEAQSLSWFANGEFTGLASPPKTIVELINERVDVTAQALGRSKDAIFKAFIEGKIPLMSFSGALVGVGMLEQNDGD